MMTQIRWLQAIARLPVADRRRQRGSRLPLARPVTAWEKAAPRRRLCGAGAAMVLGAVVVAAGPAAASVPAKTPAPPLGFRAALEQLVDDGVPGVIGLTRHGGQVVSAASGTADAATARPMAVGDRFRVGSITKTMVATVVLQLVAEHRLRLSDSVAQWLPGLVPNGPAYRGAACGRTAVGYLGSVPDAATGVASSSMSWAISQTWSRLATSPSRRA